MALISNFSFPMLFLVVFKAFGNDIYWPAILWWKKKEACSNRGSSWLTQLVIFTAVITVAYGLFGVVKRKKKSIYLKGFSFFCRPSTSCSLLRHENNDRADYDGQLLFSAGLFYFSFFFPSSRFPPSWDSFISFTQESFSSTLISLRFFFLSILIYTTRSMQIKRRRSYDCWTQPRRRRKEESPLHLAHFIEAVKMFYPWHSDVPAGWAQGGIFLLLLLAGSHGLMRNSCTGDNLREIGVCVCVCVDAHTL